MTGHGAPEPASSQHPIHLCIGAPRAGTTWLFRNLSRQPGVFTPMVKEVRYWLGSRSAAEAEQRIQQAALTLDDHHDAQLQTAWVQRWRHDSASAPPTMDAYLRLMSLPDRPSIDISPIYSVMPDHQVDLLHRGLPEASRVIYLIRDPVERMLSQMKLHFHLKGHYRGLPPEVTQAAFLRRRDQRQRSDYAAVIRRWSRRFGERFGVFVYDDLAADPPAFLNSIAEFLGLELDTEAARQTAPAFYSTDKNQVTRSTLPGATARERALVAEAVQPLVEAFTQDHPRYGKPWLRTVQEARAVRAPRPGSVDDLGEQASKLLRMCESLGDNAEYAHWQRHRGYEPTSLFRWSITPIGRLLAFLRNPGPLYAEGDLSPHSEGMVADAGSGFVTPSRLVEQDADGQLVLLQDADERRRVYTAEKAEIDFLQHKFFKQLEHDPCVYIVSRNEGLAEADVAELLDLLRAKHPEHRLLEVTQGDAREVVEDRPGLYRGQIERFAPAHRLDDYAFGGWTNLMVQIAAKPEIRELIKAMFQ